MLNPISTRERFLQCKVLFEHSSDPHVLFDDGVIIDCNQSAVQILRADTKAHVLRLHPSQLSPEFQPDGRRSCEKAAEMDALARANGKQRFQWTHRRVTGESFPVEVTLDTVELGGARTAIVAVWHDLTDRAKRESELLALNALLERKHRELVAAFTSLDEEFRAVGIIQQSLLPRSIPEIPTLALAADYRPCARAGGDYYDFFKLPNNLWGIFLADVSGHGPPAAVIMAVTHALAHSYRDLAHCPAEFLTHLHRTLARRYTSAGSFVTAFYGVFDPTNRTLRYATAGHPSPRLLRSADAGGAATIYDLEGPGGLPLGIFDELDSNCYDSASIILHPGDALLLYTDGISEARAQDGEFFGPEGLDHALRSSKPRCNPSELIHAVNDAVADFTSNAPLDDDRTLVVIYAT
jgi:serine phosphatase RsbU (regulator of sigma subunit)